MGKSDSVHVHDSFMTLSLGENVVIASSLEEGGDFSVGPS